MTPDDAPSVAAPATRRERRAAQRASASAASLTPASATPRSAPSGEPTSTAAVTERAEVATTAPAAPRPEALDWVDPQQVLTGTYVPTKPETDAPPPRGTDLTAGVRKPRRWPALLAPIALVLLVLAGYSATTLSWPLTAVPPQISGSQVEVAAAPAATPTWPGRGSASIGVEGLGAPLQSTDKVLPIASITKLVTALLVLDEMPLAVGEKGPKYSFSFRDRAEYHDYRASGQSALNVPVGGTLTEYQLLQGTLIGSANNYADRLAASLWPTDAVFAAAANRWLTERGITGIKVVNPSGFDDDNKASAADLIPLAEKALANPVIAEIVATTSVKIPGAGTVKNTNKLLADPGVVGLKTGTLDAYTLLAAKDVQVGETTVRLYSAALGQKNDKERLATIRTLFTETEAALQPTLAVPAGTYAGQVTTAWGEQVDVVTASDAHVILWNGAVPASTVDVALGGQEKTGDVVGTLSVTGPLDAQTVDLRLADDVQGPSSWWRLTHPIELFGLEK